MSTGDTEWEPFEIRTPASFVNFTEAGLGDLADVSASAAAQPEVFERNAITFQVSRDMAVGMGMVKPTPEEREAAAARRIEHEAKVKAAWETYETAMARFEAVTDPIVRAVLDHHKPTVGEYGTPRTPECHGCDVSGHDWEYPEWPCQTVALIAEHLVVPLPGDYLLSGRIYDRDTGRWVPEP